MTVRRTVEASFGTMYFRDGFPIFVNRVSETFRMQEHSHDFIEIAYVAEGKGFHYIDDQVIQARKGNLFYIPVGISHVFRPADAAAKEPLIVYNCIFSPELMERLAQSHTLLMPSEEMEALRTMRARKTWFQATDLSSDTHRLMERLLQEYGQRRPGRTVLLVAYVVELLMTAYRFLLDAHPSLAPARADSRMDEALRCIRQHADAPLTLDEIAARINVSRRQFNRLLKKTTGQTYTDYVHSLRIERCCELLRSTDRKVYELAEALGFKDMKHFHRIFKRKTGMSPREYRKQMLQEETTAEREQ